MKKLIIISLVLILLITASYLYQSRDLDVVLVDNKCNISENIYFNKNLGYQITIPIDWSVEVGQNRDRFRDCGSVRENSFQIVKGSLYTLGRQKTRELHDLIPDAIVSEWLSSEEDNPGYKYEITFPNTISYSLFPFYPDEKIEQYLFVSTLKLIK